MSMRIDKSSNFLVCMLISVPLTDSVVREKRGSTKCIKLIDVVKDRAKSKFLRSPAGKPWIKREREQRSAGLSELGLLPSYSA